MPIIYQGTINRNLNDAVLASTPGVRLRDRLLSREQETVFPCPGLFDAAIGPGPTTVYSLRDLID